MKNILLFLFFICCFWACNDNNAVSNQTENALDSLIVSTPKKATQLIQFTPEFLEQFTLADWKELMDLKRDFENLKRLNPKGLSLFLRGLERQCKTTLNADFPAPFDLDPIKSRLKVVLTEVMKSQYYATKKQNKALEESLDKMYTAYTVFIARIISAGEAETLNNQK